MTKEETAKVLCVGGASADLTAAAILINGALQKLCQANVLVPARELDTLNQIASALVDAGTKLRADALKAADPPPLIHVPNGAPLRR